MPPCNKKRRRMAVNVWALQAIWSSIGGHAGIDADTSGSIFDHSIWHHDVGLVILAALICLAGRS
jgi:hypothetical protein